MKQVNKELTLNKPKKIGRPSKFSEDLAKEICRRIAVGQSLVTICKDKDMPSWTTVWNWLNTNELFLKSYALAREASTDAMIEDMLHIADTVYTTNEAVQKARLQVDTRKWIASKLKPKKYGERVDYTSDGEKIEPLIIYRPQKLPNVIEGETVGPKQLEGVD